MKHKRNYRIGLLWLLLIFPGGSAAQLAANIPFTEIDLAIPFDFTAEAQVIISEHGRQEYLEVMIFSSSRQQSYLSIIKSPVFRMGTACLKKNTEEQYLYYPGSDAFLSIDRQTLENPCLPFLYFHFNLANTTGYTTAREGEKHTPKEIVYSPPRSDEKIRVVYREYTIIDHCWLPLSWQVSAGNESGLTVTIKITGITRTELPEFIFTRAYLQLISGY